MDYGGYRPREWLFEQLRAEFIEHGRAKDRTVSREVYADLFDDLSGGGMLLIGRDDSNGDCLVVSAPGGAVRVFHE